MAPAKSTKKKKPTKRAVKSKKTAVKRSKTTRKVSSKRTSTKKVVKKKAPVRRKVTRKTTVKKKTTKRVAKRPVKIQEPIVIQESSLNIKVKPQKLYRSGNEKIIAGVCGGIAEYFSIDPTLVRLLWVLGALVYGAGIPLYLLAWLIIPKNPDHRWD